MSHERYALVLRGGRVPAVESAVSWPAGGPPADDAAGNADDTDWTRDIAIGFDGRIARIVPVVEETGVEEWSLGGRLVLPGLVDLHQHLDKTRTVRRVVNPSGTLLGAVEAFRSYALEATREDIVARARRTVHACLARGTVAIRTHANVDLDWGVRAVEALVGLREEVRDRMHIEVVAFITASGLRIPVDKAERLVEDALDAGADVVGGAPALAADPLKTIDMLLALAARRGRRLDLHIDERLDPRNGHLAYVAERTPATDMNGRVVVSHCCALSAMPPALAKPVVTAVAQARIGVVTLPASNLFLQGRDATILPPRGLTRVKELLEAGVLVACAWDNIQDPFNPTGSGDLLEITRWTYLAAHLPWEMAPQLYAMASTVPAALMGLGPTFGVREGAWADLLIVDAADPIDAVMSGPLERTVVFHGRHVAGPSLGSRVTAGRPHA